jgi:hypothetical protein
MGHASVRKHQVALLATGLVVLCSWGFSLTGAVFASTRLVPGQYTTIQAAIDASADGDTVLLAPGVYTGVGNREIEMRGIDLVLTSREGPDATVIDCEYAGRGFYLHEGESPAARIERITIRHGWAQGDDPGVGMGGGIYTGVSHVTIADCLIVDNSAYGRGGGLCLMGSGRVERCQITGNIGSQGGGIAELVGTIAIEDCIITGNMAESGGGVVFAGTGSNTLTRCTIASNWGWDGGGVRSGNRAYLTNCIIWGNCGQPGEEQLSLDADGAEFRCCAIDTTGVTVGVADYDAFCVFTDPLFCSADPCGQTTEGIWLLDAESPCLPEHSPCGELIGALGQGCGGAPPTGACCLASGACVVESQQVCVHGSGVYMGDAVPCELNTCGPTPTRVTSWGRIKAAYRR